MAMQDYLDVELKKLCPIHGMSFGKLNDKSTWRIDFTDEATEEQKAAAQAYVDAFEWTAEKEREQADAAKLEKYKNDLSLKQGFINYKKDNHEAKFIDYLNYLEAMDI